MTTQLEKTTAQEFADRLGKQGYDLAWEVRGASGHVYDLVARRDHENIVFEFQRQSRLVEKNEQANQLRQSAKADGFTDFRLVVVPDDVLYNIEIQGLESQITRYLQHHSIEERANIFAVSSARVEGIQAQSNQPGMRAKGVAAAQFFWQDDSEEYDCPLYFDLKLNSNWQIEEVFRLELDLSSLSEILPV